MPGKPSTIVDILVAAWVVFVAFVYYGGYFNPAIGATTGSLMRVYLAALFLAVVTVVMRVMSKRSAAKT